MVTLAIAEFAIILATKLSGFTGGEDGIIMSTPGIFKVSFNMGSFMGVDITGRIITYYFIAGDLPGSFYVDGPLHSVTLGQGHAGHSRQ